MRKWEQPQTAQEVHYLVASQTQRNFEEHASQPDATGDGFSKVHLCQATFSYRYCIIDCKTSKRCSSRLFSSD